MTRKSDQTIGDETGPDQGRRALLRNAAAVLPATAFFGGCPDDGPDEGPLPSAEQRDRRRVLVTAHVGEENAHDLPGILATFSAGAQMVVNGLVFRDDDSIRQGHIDFGLSSTMSGLEDTRVLPEREYFTPDTILIEGKVAGRHVGPVAGFPATNRDVELPYLAFYRFDAAGKLVSERIVMNWGPLAGQSPG
jgi:hypothetical protein